MEHARWGSHVEGNPSENEFRCADALLVCLCSGGINRPPATHWLLLVGSGAATRCMAPSIIECRSSNGVARMVPSRLTSRVDLTLCCLPLATDCQC